MPIIHIVLFEFKPTTTHAQVLDVRKSANAYPLISISLQIPQVCTRMVALSTICRHPQTNDHYVRSYGGGRDTSPEGLQVVATLGFPHTGRVTNVVVQSREVFHMVS